MSLLPVIEDAYRAARRDSERDGHDDRPDPSDYADANDPMPVRECWCSGCLVCAGRTVR